MRTVRKTLSVLLILALFGGALPAAAETAPLQVGQTYFGFTLKQMGELPNMAATAHVFEHDKSGARLLQILCSDDNRFFSVNFQCPTPDNTGIKHIIEHCVLEGSDKYPVRGTFNELMRTSMASFLNAFTTDDATQYPFATRNLQEYWSLMDVYLNTVYHPLMLKDDKPMQKEGWRYLIREDGSVSFNGTVYNEMIGRNADPNRRLYEASFAALFPDTPYQYNAGGVREHMPDLTQEAMVAYHKTHFIPENSYMVVYGDLDTMRLLQKLDESCISDFERTGAVVDMPKQPTFAGMAEVKSTLPAEAGSPAMTAASLNFVDGSVANAEQALALNMLTDLLTASESAPLRVAMTEAGFPQTQSYYVDSQQMAVIFNCMGSGLADTATFKDACMRALTQISEAGFDREYMEGALNNAKLNIKLALTPGEAQVGLSVNSWVANTWMYGGDPIAALNFDGLFDALCEKGLKDGYFEGLIKEALLDNPHASFVTFTSDPDMKAKEDARIRAKAEEKTANWTKADIEATKTQLAALDAWSATPATTEELATLPRLTLADVDTSLVQQYIYTEKDAAGVTTLHNPYETNGIAYVNLMFDASAVPDARAPYAQLLCSMLGELDTESMTNAQLTTRIYQDTGALGFGVSAIDRGPANTFTPFAVASGYATTEKLPQMMALISEIALRTKLTDPAIRAALQRAKTNWELANSSMPINLTLNRAMSSIRRRSAYNEAISGVDYYRFLTDLDRNYDTKRDEILAALETVRGELFTKSNLMASVTMNDQDYPAFEAAVSGFAALLPEGKPVQSEQPAEPTVKNEGFTGAYGGNTVVQVGQLEPAASKGASSVAGGAIDAHLTRIVRDQGGAYGAQCSFSAQGDYMAFLSYFDPHLRETLDAFAGIPNMLRNLDLTAAELAEYQKTALNGYMAPMGPSAKGGAGLNLYLMGQDQRAVDAEVQSILDVTLDEVRALADPIEQVLAQHVLCVIGPQDSLMQQTDLFQSVQPLMPIEYGGEETLEPAA